MLPFIGVVLVSGEFEPLRLKTADPACLAYCRVPGTGTALSTNDYAFYGMHLAPPLSMLAKTNPPKRFVIRMSCRPVYSFSQVYCLQVTEVRNCVVAPAVSTQCSLLP